MSTETLIPNGIGSETALQNETKDEENWEQVDDAVGSPDDSGSHVATYSNTARDLYALPASSSEGTISKITVHFRARGWVDYGTYWAKASIKAGTTVEEGDQNNLNADNNYHDFTQEWSTNPDDSEAWEWADIDALEIGIQLYSSDVQHVTCTQVYVVVSYGPSVSAPTVTTQAVSSILATTATGNGNITDDGSETPSAWGVCVATTETPDTGDTVFSGSGAGAEGAFTASMTSLTAGQKYYVRAYATNSEGTSYGAQVNFTTLTKRIFITQG